MSTSTTPIVKLSSTAALLAFLPVLAGVPIHNSVVIAPFIGKQASRALRIGTEGHLPPAGARTLASAALGTLSRLSDCTSVAVAVFRDEPFDEIASPWYDILGVVLERLHQSGYHIKDAAIVAGDGWTPYFEGELESPRPMSEIHAETKRLPSEARADRALTMPETDPEIAQRVNNILLDRRIDRSERDSFGLLQPVTPHDPVDFLEAALENNPAEASALTIARLVAQTDTEGAVDRTVLQVAFGRSTGALSWSSTLAMRAAAAKAGCEPNDVLMQRYERGIKDPRQERLAGLLTGQTREIPSPERLHAGAVLLGRAIAHSPLPERAWVMCAFAWVQWARGLSSVAHEVIVATRRLAPSNSLAPVSHTAFEHMTPEWIFSRPQPNRAARRRASRNSG